MNHFSLRLWLALILFLTAAATPLLAQRKGGLPSPTPSQPVFEVRPFGPVPEPTIEPPARFLVEEEGAPIPRSWIISGGIALFLIVALLLWGATRAWRSSNLFDQQYRFPEIEAAALRFGAQKSGGHVARIELPPHK